ncbi:MAG: 6-carboxytetrahydropterin synthase [Lewinellaceae bacterium]|nr:6-carboxytetrahydropterin synthase [Lewinellaceae bacterium]
MAKVFLTRLEKFNAAHKLWIQQWSEEENIAYFGKCANKNWHGHNYSLYVTVKGTPDPIVGFVMDVKKLSVIMKEVIIEKLDHTNLNLDVDWLTEGMQPTTENMAILIWNHLKPHLPAHVELHCVKLQETDAIYVEYFGD